MEETGICGVCGADNVAINSDEKCEDCADVEEDNGDDLGVPEGMIDEET